MCGYPDETNSGVPSGTDLRRVPEDVKSGTGWSYDSRGWIEVNGAGANLSGITTTKSISVTAPNVTIQNTRVITGGEGFGVAIRHADNLTIKNSEIAGPSTGSSRLLVSIKDIYGDSKNTRVIGNDISRSSTGVQMEGGLIEDNYIHDLGYKPGDHLNGITSNGGSRLLTIRHNTVFNQFEQTDAISLFQDFGNQSNRVIDNNFVAGGGYTIYAGANPGKESGAMNISVTNNRFSRIYFPRGGYYGWATAYASSGSNSWSGNFWDDTGETVKAP